MGLLDLGYGGFHRAPFARGLFLPQFTTRDPYPLAGEARRAVGALIADARAA